MFPTKPSKGFSLIELMIALAIMFIVAGIAIPVYQGYIREGHYGVMRTNMHDLRTLIEDYRLDNGNYGAAGAQFSGLAAINAQYQWNPGGNIDGYTYTIAVKSGTISYDVWASHVSGVWTRCDNRLNNCCEGTSGDPASSACP